MKNSKLLLLMFFVGCILVMVSCFNDPPNTPYQPNPHDSIYRKYLADYVDSTNAPGSILCIIKPGETDWLGVAGQANKETGALMNSNTQFRIGSITKVFVSTLILKLAEEGKLSLLDTLSQWLPEVETQIPGADKITVKQLLSHLSGITDPTNQDDQYQQDIIADPVAFGAQTTRQLLQKYVYGKDLLFEPGMQYSYSNAGYWLLGLIAEKATGAELSELMKQKLFNPAQLSYTYLAPLENSNVASEYAVLSPSDTVNVSLYDAAEADGKAAGGIISTAGDMAKFYSALFSGKIISVASLAEMEQVQLGDCNNTDCEYGLGLEVWHVGTDIGYGHNGSLAGMEANALYFPGKKTTIILYKNLGGGSDKSFFEDILQ